jgi:hypothetical protein
LPIIKFQKNMFLLPNFPLANQIGAHVIIWKLVSLGFRYSSCLLPSNGLICIPKTSNTCIKNYEKGKLDSKICHFWSTLVCNHLSIKPKRAEIDYSKMLCKFNFFLLVFRIAKGCHQDFSFLGIIILVIHHFLNKNGSPLVCFHLVVGGYCKKVWILVGGQVQFGINDNPRSINCNANGLGSLKQLICPQPKIN